MKKLLISTDSFLPRWDGVSRFLNDIIPRLAEEYKIIVVAPKFHGAAPQMKDIEIIRVPIIKKAVSDIYFSWPPFKLIKKLVKDCDIVFNQTLGPVGFSAIKAAKKLGKPVVSFVHSIEWELTSKSLKRGRRIAHFFTKRYAKMLYNNCSELIVPTEETSNILNSAGIRTKKQVVNLGINIAKFMPPLDKKRSKEEVNIPSSNVVIGFCGWIEREKSLKTLKSAFLRLRKRFDNITLLIVGEGRASMMHELEGDNIILAGSKDDVLPYLQAMDIFVLPSLTETTSLSTLEAMASGLPIIATPVGYVKEYIRRGYNGYLFPKNSVDVLEQHLAELISDSVLRERFGRNARKSIIAKHRWHFTVKGVKEVLREVLDSSGRATER